MPADPQRSIAHKTAIATSWLVGWRIITRIIGFISTLILARILVPADFGLVAMASTFAAGVDALSQIGVQSALVRHPVQDRSLFDTAFTMQVLRGAVTATLLLAGAPLVADWFGEQRLVGILAVLALGALIEGAENIGIVEFKSAMNYGVQFRLLLIARLSQFAVTLTMALTLRSFWALIVGTVVGKAARVAATYVMHPYRPRFSLRGWREIAGFSLWTWAAVVAAIVWDRGDPFILGPGLGPAQLGIFLLALELALLPVSELVAPATEVLFAGFSSAQREGTASAGIAPEVAGTLLLAIMPVAITISAASGSLVAVLLGPRWEAARAPLAILAWLGPFQPFSWVCGVAMVSGGALRRNFLANVAASLIKLAALAAAVSVTHDLTALALVAVGVFVLEAATFVAFFMRVPGVRIMPAAGGILRAVIAATATIAAVSRLPGAWSGMMQGGGAGLLDIVLTGCTATAAFSAGGLFLWWVAGRPAGPEQRILALLKLWTGPFGRNVMMHFRRPAKP